MMEMTKWLGWLAIGTVVLGCAAEPVEEEEEELGSTESEMKRGGCAPQEIGLMQSRCRAKCSSSRGVHSCYARVSEAGTTTIVAQCDCVNTPKAEDPKIYLTRTPGPAL